MSVNERGHSLGRVAVIVDGLHRIYHVLSAESHVFVHSPELGAHIVQTLPRLASTADLDQEEKGSGVYKASMAGKVLRVAVEVGATVKLGALLFVMESMKMETKIIAREEGHVESIAVKEGQIVQDGQILLVLTKPQ